jgi:hypothetical protein
VLGELLDDEHWMAAYLAPHEIDDYSPPGVSGEAARTLGKLPLKNKPPVGTWRYRHITIEDLKLWKNWYAQVKEGRRTFSFEGDPQEYDLTGPVREARNPDIARVTKRPGVPDAAVAGKAGSSLGSRAPWIVGILAMMVWIGVYIFLHKRR